MRYRARAAAAALFVLTAGSVPVGAWGFDVHRFITARAIDLLPPAIRPFFEHYETAIVEHAIDPDLWRTAGWEAEPPRHFLDMDAYGTHPFPQLPRDYEAAVARYGEAHVAKYGLLPWRSAEIYGKLVDAFRGTAGSSRENVKFFSSVLTHYVADAHVPFHAALNYDGQLTGQWGVHSRFESELFERYRDTLRVQPRQPVAPSAGARDVVFDILLESSPLVAPILQADRAAVAGRELYDDEYFSRFFGRVRPILERRLADAITASAALITAAWVEAGRPALPVAVERQPRKVRRGR